MHKYYLCCNTNIMKANKKQKQLIHLNTASVQLKEALVQHVTNDATKVSTNDLTFDQANTILKILAISPVDPSKEDSPIFWAYFDTSNKQHKYIQSLLHQIKWTIENPKYGRVPDLKRFGSWLQSDKAPISKPLKKMNQKECSKTIEALSGILKSKYK